MLIVCSNKKSRVFDRSNVGSYLECLEALSRLHIADWSRAKCEKKAIIAFRLID